MGYIAVYPRQIMNTMSLFSSSTNYVGIDIGSSSIKAVSLKKEGNQVKLASYGFSENSDISQNDLQKNVIKAAKTINRICDEAGITSKNAISALPTFSVFTSVLNLAGVGGKDMAAAVHWEAKKVIPLPLEEMILDWKRIGGDIGASTKDDKGAKDKKNMKVLLTGAPKSLVKKYIAIFKEAKINLISLETEIFSLVRALLGNDKSTIMIVEMGAGTTDISIVDKGIPILNRSIDVGGFTITKKIGEHLHVEPAKAEQFKYDLGITSIESRESEVPKAIEEVFNPIVNEIKYANNLFQSKSGKTSEKIVLSGGSALLPNLANYLSKVLNTKVIIGDPWARISYPEDLKPLLAEIGPRMSVAVGLALREME